MAINLKNAPDIILEEPGSLFKGLAGTVLQNALTNLFYEARKDAQNIQSNLEYDRRKEESRRQTTHWEAIKLQTDWAQKLSSLEGVEEAKNETLLKISNKETTSQEKDDLNLILDALDNREKTLLDNMPDLDIKGMTGASKEQYDTIKSSKDSKFIGEVADDWREDVKRFVNAHANPERNQEKYLKDSDNFDELFKGFENTYLDKDGFIRQDLTVDEIENANEIQESLKVLSESMEEQIEKTNVYITSDDNEETQDKKVEEAISYFHGKGDKVSAHGLELLAARIETSEQEEQIAKSQENFNSSVFNFQNKLSDLKKNPEEFGELSLKLIEEQNEILNNNVSMITSSNVEWLDDITDKIDISNQSIELADFIKFQQNPDNENRFVSEQALDNLSIATQHAENAFNYSDSKSLTSAKQSINNAVKSEHKHHISRAKSLKDSKKLISEDAKQQLGVLSEQIEQSFGKDLLTPEAKKNISDVYKSGGEFQLDQNPSSTYKQFKLSNRETMDYHKSYAAKEISKLVKSSDLDNVKDKTKVRQLTNKILDTSTSPSKKAELMDELYINHLKDANNDLNFEGWGAKDTTAKQLYSTHLNMFKILYETDIQATQKFGEDYSFKYIQDNPETKILDIIGDNYDALFNAP